MEWAGFTKDDRTPASATDAPSSGRILVCDDAEQIRGLIRVNLELDGYEVTEASDGQEAVEILRDSTQPLPDVITIDALMPRRDGWWAVSMIRADPRLMHIPIVMVTASVQPHDRAQAKNARLDGFVAKPFDPDDLLALIGDLVVGGRSETVSTGGAAPLESSG
jgi:CheY-like chemotaxis protein